MGRNKKQQQKIQRKKKRFCSKRKMFQMFMQRFFTQNQCRNWLICLYGLLENSRCKRLLLSLGFIKNTSNDYLQNNWRKRSSC